MCSSIFSFWKKWIKEYVLNFALKIEQSAPRHLKCWLWHSVSPLCLCLYVVQAFYRRLRRCWGRREKTLRKNVLESSNNYYESCDNAHISILIFLAKNNPLSCFNHVFTRFRTLLPKTEETNERQAFCHNWLTNYRKKKEKCMCDLVRIFHKLCLN